MWKIPVTVRLGPVHFVGRNGKNRLGYENEHDDDDDGDDDGN